ncbi:pyruvate, phosphate dikinase [Rhodococcus sp. IEGM 1366]|uniref:pyruvate, phosphate dikinase n=1 Tax=Rhodococcus sp. IEGM 1366 TaxID=3082223 RepID=UPI00295384C1|nr:pyruvate, phosphate dikinase [Rhodococcus sp. IEGM 1366]MDV8070730.1 pyruvate, phosphate dikinase [Rhodococcus sp. IEGM 1366]
MSAAITTSSLTRSFNEAGPVDRELLGGKGYGLVGMTQSGLNVPPGYIVSTSACHKYLSSGELEDDLQIDIAGRLADLEALTQKSFGGGPHPLLLSVRSGAPISMPGMMDTILNLGLNRDAAIALAESTGDFHFMADVLFRFHNMYSETVLGALETPDRDDLDSLLGELDDSASAGEVYDTVWSHCQTLLQDELGEQVPSEPIQQLLGAVEAVFRSWNTKRAIKYRELHKIPDSIGTAVVVQTMVFGNLDESSGSGVVFTRNPVTGEPGLFGEYLAASQGEDVVAGTRTPDPVSSLSDQLPEVFAELESTCAELERTRGDVLDIEFTVERGVLYMLQVRNAKRTAQAAIRIAANLLQEAVITPEVALDAVSLDQIRQVQRPGFDPVAYEQARQNGRVLGKGVGAAPGHVVGELYFTSEAAQEAAKNGRTAILARPVTSPTDLHGMIASAGILTATGGSTSHAAVVARALGTTCVVGAGSLDIDPAAGTLTAAGVTLNAGDVISLDGTSGEILSGAVELSEPAAEDHNLAELLTIARSRSTVELFARVTTVDQVTRTAAAGAIGFVAGIDSVLAASGHLDSILNTIYQHDARSAASLLERAVAEEFSKIFAAAGEVEFGVRAIDFDADESSELLRSYELFIAHPELALPLGSVELLEAQIRGIAKALEKVDRPPAVHFTVRKINEVAEVEALESARAAANAPVEMGAYIATVLGATQIPVLARSTHALWIELRELQATVLGIPTRHLHTAEPLDSYVRRGLLDVDPRSDLDGRVELSLDAAAASADDGARIGIRLTGPFTAELVNKIIDSGFTRLAVDADEVRTATLALGRASNARA